MLAVHLNTADITGVPKNTYPERTEHVVLARILHM